MNCQCGCGLPGHDWHHALLGRKKGLAILSDKRNLVFVNHFEHIARKFDNQKYKRFFWELHCQIYGEPAMQEWLDEVHRQAPKLDRSRFSFVESGL
jgi:hypothetical protein